MPVAHRSPRPPGHRTVIAMLRSRQDPARAAHCAKYFKTGPGEYGEGDRFLGIAVPDLRKIARELRTLSLADCTALLDSGYNEARLVALLILVAQYRRGDDATRRAVYQLFMRQRSRINNWNLVDSAAPQIVGEHLRTRSRAPLRRLANSSSLWDRRIAVVATQALIRAGDHGETLALCEQLLGDREDLIHKACGWMLREVGQRDRKQLEAFLAAHCRRMPRTMLRYAVEHFSAAKRRRYLAGSATAAKR